MNCIYFHAEDMMQDNSASNSISLRKLSVVELASSYGFSKIQVGSTIVRQLKQLKWLQPQ
jgi:hypothetical protein